jgi:hypothetical protein
MMRMWIWIIGTLIIGLMIYIRVAPSDVARWHVNLSFDKNATEIGGSKRVIDGDAAQLIAKLDTIIRSEPRTIVLAGSVAEGWITYVVRTKWMGFPDYVTMQSKNDGIRLFSRLRFGRSDLGVNAARLDRWIAGL